MYYKKAIYFGCFCCRKNSIPKIGHGGFVKAAKRAACEARFETLKNICFPALSD
jgi:hypothetical protein